MGLYNFKPQFVPYVLDGTKTHTIRAERKGHNDSLGDIMHLYTGLRRRGPIIQKLESGAVVRQKMSRLLMRTPCVKTEFVRIEADLRVRIGMRLSADLSDIGGAGVRGGFLELDRDEKNELAWRDGFRFSGAGSVRRAHGRITTFDLMMQFWEGRLPFEGVIYHWNPRVQLAPRAATMAARRKR